MSIRLSYSCVEQEGLAEVFKEQVSFASIEELTVGLKKM